FSAVRAIGLDFIEMLEETNRRSITDRNTLGDIYNEEFRDRDGRVKDPNFSRVIFALRNGNKARLSRSGRHVYFNTNVRVRLHDQWFRSCRRRQNQASPAPGNVSSLSATSGQDASVPGPEGGVRGRRRLAKDILQRLNSTERSFFITDKYGVQVSSELCMEDGKIQICVDRAEVYELKLFVENTGQEAVYFTYYTSLHWLQYFTLEDSRRVTRNNPHRLEPREKYEVTVRFKSSHVGVYSATLAFEFKQNTQPTTRPFHIVRFIEVEYRTKLAALLGPTEPFKPLRLNISEPENYNIKKIKYEIIRNYNYTHYFNKQITCTPVEPDGSDYKGNALCSHLAIPNHARNSLCLSLLQSPLGFHNYAERFDLLLYLEECQMHVDIKRYNKDQVTLFKDYDKRLMVLNLPGVSENRPSVLRGDHLLLTKSEEVQLSTVTKYKGYVHKVELDRVKLGFSRRFLDHVYVDNMKFSVEFTVNRLPLRLQHRAVHMAVQHELRDVLFPVGSRDVTPASPPALRLFNQHLERNPEQYSAVCNIVAGTSKPAPYLVFGPPGTGKTVTIVEAIKQVKLKNIPDAYILACAPSNSAADQLCEKLITSQHVDSRKIYRLYASSRDPKYIPENNSNLEGEMIVFPCKEDLMCYKILVSTLVTTGRLVSGGFPVDHFSHIFVDEAGHAVELETIISVAGLLNAETGQVVLAGDPRQLGPILRSPLAINHGLDISLLERLMTQNDLYKKDNMEFDKRYVTKLLLNYRSHPSILKVPNELFYDGELVACANEISSNQYCTWEHLPKRGFPVIFHGVPGKDERESNSPSFFNIYEIEIILGYLKKLLLTQAKKGISRISPRDIGIIAPYRKQVEKIKWAIRTDEDLQNYMCITDLKVGSVEEFQGQERKVILVSAVRSSKEHIILDEPFNIGFLKNEKRFNVAVTRAKALFIMVGNPTILRTDETWGRFIDFCFEQGGYTGLPFISVEGIEEVEKCLLALNIQDERGESRESSLHQLIIS
uniref:RNA helicase n=1 Tax=Sinocyclocheilus anshuiensis TaxID=1608454 RepID=A0A671PTU6_9TELE